MTQKEQLLINGHDAWELCGAVMGSGFIDALSSPAPMKDYIEGASRLTHGKTVITDNARKASREVTLRFNIHGGTEAEFNEHRAAFYDLLYAGDVTVQVLYDGVGGDVYHLVYKKPSEYAGNRRRTFCTVAVKFEEPDPTYRS